MTISKVVLYDPALSSLNIGDEVISDSARRELAPLLERSFTVGISTHLPVSSYLRHLRDADYKIVLGSNLLRGRMNGLFRQWDIHLGTAFWVRPAILMGVGWWQYGDRVNAYTRYLYSKVLSRAMVHSVRDSYTERQLRELGFTNVLMTGCPSMWQLTPEYCEGIPQTKAPEVVTTLTDYNRDPRNDRDMLLKLVDQYKTVHVWIQGYNDMTYLDSLEVPKRKVEIINPSLSAFDALLSERRLDYIGTRLHAGIRALQHKRRTLIVAIDNRATEKSRDFGLPIAQRGDRGALHRFVTQSFPTQIRIPEPAIAEWKSQFSV